MDILSKWAMIGCECLTNNAIYTNGQAIEGYGYGGYEKEKIAVMLMTGNGCLDVDKRYLHSTETIASPSLFVYTLPNIMLGEICIKHGFKGEQLCMVDTLPNETEIQFWVNDILQNRNMDACLCGWVDALEDKQTVHLLWIDKKKGYGFSAENLKAIFSSI
jgi:hypothetical protein